MPREPPVTSATLPASARACVWLISVVLSVFSVVVGWSDVRSATIHEACDARDDTGVIRGQTQRRLGHCIGLPQTSHRDGGHHPRHSGRRLLTFPCLYSGDQRREEIV